MLETIIFYLSPNIFNFYKTKFQHFCQNCFVIFKYFHFGQVCLFCHGIFSWFLVTGYTKYVKIKELLHYLYKDIKAYITVISPKATFCEGVPWVDRQYIYKKHQPISPCAMFFVICKFSECHTTILPHNYR